NIKERRDCSCAVFDDEGQLVAQSKDIPVHLGAMPCSVRACIDELEDDMSEGSMALLNDPYSGGSHLPDLTVVCPVFMADQHVGFVANRAHHADIGGTSPGSMPGLSLDIHEEGIVIPPRLIVKDWKLVTDWIDDILKATRTPEERLGDLASQIAANTVGARRLQSIMKEHGTEGVLKIYHELKQYSMDLMQKAMIPYAGMKGTSRDYMESDGAGSFQIPIVCSISISDRGASITFEGTANQVAGNINCPIASTLSSVYYVFIAVFGKGIPINEGCWSILDTFVPSGSLLNPLYPAAVSAGNVETSQRIVDVVLGCLSKITPEMIPAASQGTMNNLTIGGFDGRFNKPFSFYETIGGGSGGIKGLDGASGIHTHMTNTLNTPIESLEIEYPLRITRYSLRTGSGGDGRWKGGEGLIREIELLDDDFIVSIQSERRFLRPSGLAGGGDAQVGKNVLTFENQEYVIQSKTTVKALKGSKIRIETPGGGGWGSLSTSK
ncbi:MAG: hydantoinase B/oxoprolinase family protein, partial [Candidatus Thorarchaeota archaeon]